MMSSVKKKGLIIALSAACLLCAGLATTSLGKKTALRAEAATVVGVEFSDLYNYGETVALPGGAEIEYHGNKLAASKSYLVFPDGNARIKDEYTLDQYGCYEAVFEAEANGLAVTATKSFTVKKSYYSVDKNSTISYGELNKSFANMGYKKGIKAELTEGGTLYYNKPINLYESNNFELIYLNCLQFDTVCKGMTVRLTDCYDPSIYVDLHYVRGNYDYQTYVDVSAYGKKKAGVSASENGTIVIDGENYSLVNSFNDSNGTIITGNLNENKNYYNFGFVLDTTDHKNIKVYVNHTNGSNTALVSELNNKDIYDYGFDGFTDGNVYLSVTASGLVGVESASVEIGKITGDSNGDLAYAEYCEDDTAPIFIEENAVSQRKIVANSVSVKIPTVYAYDDTGVRGDSLADYVVWYNRGSASEKMVKVENGKFFPTAVGKYTVEYTATDYFNNKGVYSIVLNATKDGEQGIKFEITSPLTSVEAGRTIKFDNYSITGINGEVSVKIIVTDPKGNRQELTQNDEYLVEYSGEYKVDYLYEDVLYSGEKSVSFTAAPSQKPIFAAEGVSFNHYYINGYTYSVEKPKAYTYSENGAAPVAVETYVKFDDGEFNKIADEKNITINAIKKVRFKFKCEGSDVELLSEEINVVGVKANDGSLDITKFFVGNIKSAYTDRNGTTYTVDNNGTIEFINPLLFNKAFNFKFMIPSANSVSKMIICLTDYYNATNVLKIELSGNNAFSVNGSSKRTMTNGWKGYTTDIAYSDGNLKIGDASVSYNSVFESGLCFLSVDFESPAATDLTVNELCTQSFANVKSDNIGPILYYKNVEKVAPLGSTLVIPKPYAADVLSPASLANLKMSVYKNNKIITDLNGITLKDINDFTKEYAILLDDYGVYKVIYSYSDAYGNAVEQAYSRFTVNVIDVEAPVITVNEDISKTFTVAANTEVPVIDYSVSDNYTKEKRLTVWVVVKDDVFNTVSAERNAKNISLPKAGEYTVYIYCKDAEGNTSYISYKVTAR